MKRPAFQFYPADWRKDTELQSCGIAARGLWHELLCIMHECEPYGHLTVSGAPATDAQAARLAGVDLRDYRKLLAELFAAGVPGKTDAGIIYSRRMVRDEQLRMVRAEAGKLGGNPSLVPEKVNQNGTMEVSGKVNQKPTPSSSASASASSSELQNREVVTPTGTARANGSHPAVENDGNSTAKTVVKSWWKSQAGVAATAKTVGIERRSNEADDAFKDRVYAAVEEKRRQDQLDAVKRATKVTT